MKKRETKEKRKKQPFNPLKAELNPICHLLALLEAHHIFHVSGLRVKSSIIFANTVANLVNDMACVKTAILFVTLPNILQNFLPQMPEECG